jgi:hypothetical protein
VPDIRLFGGESTAGIPGVGDKQWLGLMVKCVEVHDFLLL